MPEAELVYSTKRTSGAAGPLVIHTNRDCKRLSIAKNIIERPRDVVPHDARECTYCSGEVDLDRPGCNGPWQILQDLDPDTEIDGGETA